MKKPLNIKKLVLLNLPYILMGLFATNFGEAWRMAQGADASEKALSLISVLPAALGSFWPSFQPDQPAGAAADRRNHSKRGARGQQRKEPAK